MHMDREYHAKCQLAGKQASKGYASVEQAPEQEQASPRALRKASLPSRKENTAMPRAPRASSPPMPVSSYPTLEARRTTERYMQARVQAASARMAEEPRAFPTLTFRRISAYMVAMDMRDMTMPQKVVSGACPPATANTAIARSPPVRR